MKLKIKVTKDILKKSVMCGAEMVDDYFHVAKNCAIALAVRDVFPYAGVDNEIISPFFTCPDLTMFLLPNIILPKDARDFINHFDSMRFNPQGRLDMPEFEFEVYVPEDIVNVINIEDIYQSETLELID